MDRIESRKNSVGMNEKTQAKAFHGGDIGVIRVVQ